MCIIKMMISLILLLSISSYAQNDSDKSPRFSHNPKEIDYYNIDGLMLKIVQIGGIMGWSVGKKIILPEQLLNSFKFNEDDIIRYRVKKDTTFIQTHLVIVLDSLVLIKKDQKKKHLSGIEQSKIISIERLDNDEAVKQYGELGKKGVVIIITKQE